MITNGNFVRCLSFPTRCTLSSGFRDMRLFVILSSINSLFSYFSADLMNFPDDFQYRRKLIQKARSQKVEQNFWKSSATMKFFTIFSCTIYRFVNCSYQSDYRTKGEKQRMLFGIVKNLWCNCCRLASVRVSVCVHRYQNGSEKILCWSKHKTWLPFMCLRVREKKFSLSPICPFLQRWFEKWKIKF